jgi:hypothetical protein
MISVVTVVGSNAEVLPHMLNHYKTFGVHPIYIHIHAQTFSDPIVEQITTVAERYEATIASTNVVPWSQAINPLLYRQTLNQSPDDWFILADQDELHGYPDSPENLIRFCEKHGYDYVEGCFVDRLTESGVLDPVRESPSIMEQFPLGACVTGPILKGVINKIVLARGHVKLAHGQHHAYSGVPCPISELYVPVYHFKWTDGLLQRLRERVKVLKGIREGWWIESQRFLDFCDNEGRIPLKDSRLMVAPCKNGYLHWEILKSWREASPYFRRF